MRTADRIITKVGAQETRIVTAFLAQHEWKELLSEALSHVDQEDPEVEDGTMDAQTSAILRLADTLRATFSERVSRYPEDAVDILRRSLYACALQRVSWDSIAKTLLTAAAFQK